MILAAGVLALLFIVPAGDDPFRLRVARTMGLIYAISSAVLGVFQVLPRMAVFRDPMVPRILAAGLMFLVNLPALLYLRKALRDRPRPQEMVSTEERGLAGLVRDAGLSEREREIIRLVALGLGNREIGKKLFISPKTVKNHMTSIYAKTGARNRVQLANLLNRPGI